MAAMGCWPLTPLDAHPGSIVLPIPEIKSNNFQEPWRFSPNLSKMTSIITSRGHKLWQWNIVKHTETTSSPETKWGIASGETQHAATATETSGIQVMALVGRRAESCQHPEDVMGYQVLPKVRWNFGKKTSLCHSTSKSHGIWRDHSSKKTSESEQDSSLNFAFKTLAGWPIAPPSSGISIGLWAMLKMVDIYRCGHRRIKNDVKIGHELSLIKSNQAEMPRKCYQMTQVFVEQDTTMMPCNLCPQLPGARPTKKERAANSTAAGCAAFLLRQFLWHLEVFRIWALSSFFRLCSGFVERFPPLSTFFYHNLFHFGGCHKNAKSGSGEFLHSSSKLPILSSDPSA